VYTPLYQCVFGIEF